MDDLEKLTRKRKPAAATGQMTVTVCAGTGCTACGCRDVLAALEKLIAKRGDKKKIAVLTTGCHGFCEQGPLMVIEPGNIFYRHVTPADVPEIVKKTLEKGEVIDRLLYQDPITGRRIVCEKDIPFYEAQDRTILGQNKLVDPTDIHAYIALGGYSALFKALKSMKPDEIMHEVHRSGLRGRGGAGFLTARKWEFCRKAPGEVKYVVCNADEGDPGAYMDRSVLEGNPHVVIEGMLIGAFAIGARHGYVYVRNEYPLAVEHIKTAVKQAQEMGLLGENILGTGFSFDIKVARGGGAFVCGESTALMASLEGKVGEPKPKDIHTAERGFRDCPTNLNNVETWANIPSIILNGGDWFAEKGTHRSKGTKIFALTGKVKNTGLIEVPMGVTLRDIVYKIGGGSSTGNPIKAIQTGGPSGGCLPEKMFDLKVDFEDLHHAGSMVGSGGMVVMDTATCMVDVAKYFLNFLMDESCGKCVPCRVGLSRMHEIIDDITKGKGTMEKLDLLRETAETVATASLCGLGKTAPNPVLSTLQYFFDEYEAHINEKRCPAGVCRDLITYSIDAKKCKGCGMCLAACPHGAITGERREPHVIDPAKCHKCGICVDKCKFDAIVVS